MTRLLALLLLAACARVQPLGHSAAWRACKVDCDAVGAAGAVVVETDLGRGCVCAKKPEAT